MFYLSFPALVLDPTSTLAWTLPPLLVFQIGHSFTCLPSALSASTSALTTPGKAERPRKRNADKGSIFAGQFVPAVLSTLLALAVGTPVVLVAMILLGAPLTTHLPHTLLASAHFSLLAVMPLLYVHGGDREKWRDILSASMPIDEPFGAALGTLIGAWLGAVPIPLDWDREWQKWPVTIVTGAYCGYLLGGLAGRYVLRGKVIDFD